MMLLRLARRSAAALFFGAACVVSAACSSSQSSGPSADASASASGDDGAAAIASDAGAGNDASASSGDAGATSSRKVCLVACTQTSDCQLNGGGACEKGLCVLSAGGIDACNTDPDCVPYGSSFELDPPCTKKADCGLREACIAFKGKGICQRVPDATHPCTSFLDMKELDWQSIDGATIKICGRDSYVCEAGKCRSGCTADADCKSSSTPKCDTARHKCVCQGSSCAGGTFAGEVCLADGRCGCKSDGDCKVTQGFDKCYGDTCGCSGDSACAGIVQGASLVCAAR